MEVEITSDIEEMVRAIMRLGNYRNGTEVFHEALILLKERAQLCHDVGAGLAELDRGLGKDAEEVFRRLGARVARRAKTEP